MAAAQRLMVVTRFSLCGASYMVYLFWQFRVVAVPSLSRVSATRATAVVSPPLFAAGVGLFWHHGMFFVAEGYNFVRARCGY